MRVGSAPSMVVFSMFVLRHQIKVVRAIITSITVLVVDVIAFWNRPITGFPNITVQKAPLAVGASIVPSVSQGVAMATEDNVGQGFGACPENKLAELEHLIDALPSDAEHLGDCRQAVPVLIQLIHGLRLVILPKIRTWAEARTHSLIIDGGVTGVNLCR